MAIARSKLTGMQVYNPDGALVGQVLDIALPIGQGEIMLIVRTVTGSQMEIPWSKVSAAKDIVILKEVIEVPQLPVMPAAPTRVEERERGLPIRLPGWKKEKRTCPFCGKEASWIEQYQRWYCYNCRKYID